MRLLTFKVNHPAEENGQMKSFQQTIEALFIGPIPIPSPLIDRIDVNFQMEVTNTNTEEHLHPLKCPVISLPNSSLQKQIPVA